MLGAAGFDFAFVNCEHTAFGVETAETMFRACDANGPVPVVRAPSSDPGFVGKALDACTAVAAGRFAPQGTRGACRCVRAGGHFNTDWRGYVARQERETGVMVLVETAEGLANIEAICAVEGLLALVVGPFDLSVSLGFQGDYRHLDVQAAIKRMLAAAQATALPVIAPIFNPDAAEAATQQREWRAGGDSYFVVGTDKFILADAMRSYLKPCPEPMLSLKVERQISFLLTASGSRSPGTWSSA